MATLNINIASASETAEGLIEIATQVETDAGTDDLKALTPKKLEDSTVRTEVTANTAKVGITPTQASDITANNAKVTNATHTSEVTGSTALTVNKVAISNKTLVTAVAGDHVLVGDASDSDNLKKVNVSDFLGSSQSYTLIWLISTWSPADSTTYWAPTGQQLTPSTATNGNRRNKIPVAATNFTLNIGLAANGTTEAVTWTIRNHTQSTEANFTPTHAFTASGQANAWNGTASLSCDADDFIEIKLTTPVWSTNPTGVRATIILNFQPD